MDEVSYVKYDIDRLKQKAIVIICREVRLVCIMGG